MVFDATESLIESILRDAVTFGFILLCIYCSHGSNWWTFFCGSVALLFLSGKAVSSASKTKRLSSKAEAIKWAESLED